MTIHRLLLNATVLFIAASLSGCMNGKKGGPGMGGGNDSDFVNGTPLPERQEGTSFTSANVDRNKFHPVYFGFDSFAIGSGEKGKIQEVAEFLHSASNTLIIAGFTDERGTPEYNRGLGERRAQAVRRALMLQGVAESQLTTVSFGAERPAVEGDDEAAWAQNRRVELVYSP